LGAGRTALQAATPAKANGSRVFFSFLWCSYSVINFAGRDINNEFCELSRITRALGVLCHAWNMARLRDAFHFRQENRISNGPTTRSQGSRTRFVAL
jgi:hypothetical protein